MRYAHFFSLNIKVTTDIEDPDVISEEVIIAALESRIAEIKKGDKPWEDIVEHFHTEEDSDD